MGGRSFTNDRLAGLAIGAVVVGAVTAVVLTASGAESQPAANEPEVAMPAPQVEFDDLDREPPPVAAAASVSSTTEAPTAVEAPSAAGARTVRLRGAMTLEAEFSPLDADRRATYTLVGRFFGDMTGQWEEEGSEQYGDADDAGHVRSVGSGTATAELTVPGVGTGRVETTNEWRSDNDGTVLGVSTIISGSGELEGVTGTMRWNSTDDAGTITYQLDLTVPGR